MASTKTDSASFIYEYKEQMGWRKEPKIWRILVDIRFFGLYKLVIIQGDALQSQFPIEKVLSQFVCQYTLKPTEVIFLSQVRKKPEIWEVIRFSGWDGRLLSLPSWSSVPAEIVNAIRAGTILPGSYLAVTNNTIKESLTRKNRAKANN